VAVAAARLAATRPIHAVWSEDARVDPAAAGRRTVRGQLLERLDLTAVVDAPRAVGAPGGAVGPSRGLDEPAVDLGQDRLHLRLAVLVLRVPPVERPQGRVARVVRRGRPGLEAPGQL